MTGDETVAIVEVRGLTKHFGDRVAVADVSFTVPRAGSLGIVGESGSGKTTVARMLCGLTAPSAGSIVVCGRDRTHAASRLSERRLRARELQIVFQDPYSSLDGRQTIAACLNEILRLHHHDLDRQARSTRVDELMQMVGLSDSLREAVPGRLSGGQRQRVAIARALAAEPRVLVLDESVSALDVSIQAQILNLLADIRASTDVTYLVISHDLAVIRHVTERCVVMCAGRIVEHGPTADVLDSPTAEYTRTLRASVPGPGWRPTRQPGTPPSVPVQAQ
jgi:oligopeptide transport system ATP-binding protein